MKGEIIVKKPMVICLLVGLVLIACTSFADEIYKTDGSIIKGKIIEVIPNESYKIQTSDGSIFVVKAYEVAKITYAPIVTGKGEKSPAAAVGLAFLLPSLGHAYAGDWNRGSKFLLLDIGAFIVIAVGESQTETVNLGYGITYEETSDEGASLAALGYIGLIAFRVWEFVDAYKTAEDYNTIAAGMSGFNIELDNRSLVAKFTRTF